MQLILDNVHLQLGQSSFDWNVRIESSITGVFGVSGAGKTTLLNVISGVLRPDQGRLEFNGRVLDDAEQKIFVPQEKRRIGVVFQEGWLFPHMTIRQNLEFGMQLRARAADSGDSNRFPWDDVLDLLDISKLLDKKPGQISGGERQRVAIGRTLLSQPDLLLMDEPFSNLDQERRGLIINFLLKINSYYKLPMMVISHDLQDLLRLTRVMMVVHDGVIDRQGNALQMMMQSEGKQEIVSGQFSNVLDLQAVEDEFASEDSFSTMSDGDGLSQNPLLDDSKDDWLVKKSSNRPDDLLMFRLGSKAGQVLALPRAGILPEEIQSADQSIAKSRSQESLKIRISIAPDEIALSRYSLKAVSIRNQIPAVLRAIKTEKQRCMLLLDCGRELIAEITLNALQQMELTEGMTVYCLIKARSVHVVHVWAGELS